MSTNLIQFMKMNVRAENDHVIVSIAKCADVIDETKFVKFLFKNISNSSLSFVSRHKVKKYISFHSHMFYFAWGFGLGFT